MTSARFTLLLVLQASACLPPEVSLQGKVCDPDHPCGPDLECCRGECARECDPCPERSCALQWAIDCADHRVCLDGCWEPCAACAARCDDPGYRACSTGEVGQDWLCREQQVCVLKQAGPALEADCAALAPGCSAQVTCACLADPPLITPYAAEAYPTDPCDTGEICHDRGDYLLCLLPLPPDAGAAQDGGSTVNDASSTPESGCCLYDGAAAGDAAGYPDTLTPMDSGASVDAGGPPDASSPADGSAAADAGAGPDSSMPDSSRPDSSRPDAAGPCGPIAPDCFAGLGTGPFGERCCTSDALPASCDGSMWSCASGLDFATRCDGFGEVCMEGAAPSCSADDPCVWSWDSDGAQQCTDYGPAVPCVQSGWSCISGTAPRSGCDCVVPACTP